MNRPYTLWSIRGLLFVFDIENTHDLEREEIIVSKNVNDNKELAELFDILLRPEFFIYSEQERISLIETLSYFLEVGNSFDEVFSKMDTYFDDDVKDQRQFMKVLLGCLGRYQSQGNGNN
ncbi:hypothetical protein ABH908_000859 [Pseudomonas frederiksbergensis]|jgi:hypothetical protein|uniref:hypothetical protein n=1 Tax=Pseudomonas TaxID=286 RepID=UPI00110EB635|nr:MULTISPECIES: hypothetical protein [unclassified Pseudomonas]MBD9617754.1 hypothetical protein [Pseudomonas sp. PDM07]QDV93388.1 hypothetical protein FFH90_003285 [Pseudomonas sp. ATCC 43928]CAH0125425.1 hypothetical protein SRABI130_00121 [Pseudomonas sp. Bi130]